MGTFGLLQAKGTVMQQQTTDTAPDTRSDLLKDIEDIFADPETWLNMPNLRLAGRKPIDLIGTPDEELVRNITESIKHGLYT
jgi:antitoxin Xre/MbcA/ParS-like protein